MKPYVFIIQGDNMLYNLKGELIKLGLDPVKAVKRALNCSEKTARNKINCETDITVPEAVTIIEQYFKDTSFSIQYLFTSITLNSEQSTA